MSATDTAVYRDLCQARLLFNVVNCLVFLRLCFFLISYCHTPFLGDYSRMESLCRIWSQWFITSQSTSNTWKLKSNSARFVHNCEWVEMSSTCTNMLILIFCVTSGRAAGVETAGQSGGGGEWETANTTYIQSFGQISEGVHNPKLHGKVCENSIVNWKLVVKGSKF